MFVVLDSALECPKTSFDLSSCHFYFSLSLSLSLPRAPSLHKRESDSPLDKSVATHESIFFLELSFETLPWTSPSCM
ncbi:hypothetical protein AMTRI_Chr02g253790 [Amborella trichopoda]